MGRNRRGTRRRRRGREPRGDRGCRSLRAGAGRGRTAAGRWPARAPAVPPDAWGRRPTGAGWRGRGRSRRGRACGWATGSSNRWGPAPAPGPRRQRRCCRRRAAPGPSRCGWEPPARAERRRPHARRRWRWRCRAGAGRLSRAPAPGAGPAPRLPRSRWPGPPSAGPHPPTGAGRPGASRPPGGVSQSPTSMAGGTGTSSLPAVDGLELLDEADASDLGDQAGITVTHPFGRLAQAAGDQHEDGEQADAGEQQLEPGERVPQPLHEGDTGERPAERGDAADDGHREDQQAVRSLVGVEADPAQRDGVDGARQAGEHPGEDEGHEPGLDRVHARGGGRPVVVASGGDDPPGARPAQVGHDGQRRDQQGQRERVEPALVDQLDGPEDLGPRVRRGQQRLVVGRVEEIELHRHGKGERGHGQELARDPQGRRRHVNEDELAAFLGQGLDDPPPEAHADPASGERAPRAGRSRSGDADDESGTGAEGVRRLLADDATWADPPAGGADALLAAIRAEPPREGQPPPGPGARRARRAAPRGYRRAGSARPRPPVTSPLRRQPAGAPASGRAWPWPPWPCWSWVCWAAWPCAAAVATTPSPVTASRWRWRAPTSNRAPRVRPAWRRPPRASRCGC